MACTVGTCSCVLLHSLKSCLQSCSSFVHLLVTLCQFCHSAGKLLTFFNPFSFVKDWSDLLFATGNTANADSIVLVAHIAHEYGLHWTLYFAQILGDSQKICNIWVWQHCVNFGHLNTLCIFIYYNQHYSNPTAVLLLLRTYVFIIILT